MLWKCHNQNQTLSLKWKITEKMIFPIVSLWELSVAMETTILIQSAPNPNAYAIYTDFFSCKSLKFQQKIFDNFNMFAQKVQVGKDQEKAQSEKDSHSKNRGGKKPN